MKADQVDQALRQKFLDEDERLVFWSDPKSEFAEYVERGLPAELEAVTVLDVSNRGGFSTKLLLEREKTEDRFLLYSTGEALRPEEDWLLDIRSYSAEFHADVASIWLQELGLQALSLRDHLKARAAFLRSRDRRKKLARLIAPRDDAAAIDLKMMAVLAGSQVADLFPVVRGLCHGHVADGCFDLGETPKAIALFDKMGLAERFWKMVGSEFGYAPTSPTVAGLLRCLFVSEFLHQAGGASIEAIAQFALPPAGRQNAVVYLTQWRDSSGQSASYDAAAGAVAAELRVSEQLDSLSSESLRGVFTFWEVEQSVVRWLKIRVLEEAQAIDVDAIRAVATERKAGHWLAGPGRDGPERRAVAGAYDAIVAAAELFALRIEHQKRLKFDSPAALLAAYQSELYRFDQLYRHHCAGVRLAQGQRWDRLKTLADEVERVYGQSFLQPLGLEWGRLLDDGFLGRWRASEMPPQQGFYARTVRPYLAESDRRRAIVIISDAFRYEAAQELVENLNGQYRFRADLSAMLGVLPSHTTLGMASLLPHERLEYTDKGDVLVDGKSVASTDARSKQLATVNGMACQAKDLMSMKLEEARELTKDFRVIYVYHNLIDARGDSASTESETFAAVEECIQQLADLVKQCADRLNVGTVWVTADHGFLFQQASPGQTDKSTLTEKPTGTVKAKKRYIIGRDLGQVAEVHHGYAKTTAGSGGDMEFWVPRGTNRFYFTGGARFIHGGAMPQEVVVPLVKATRIFSSSKKAASRSEKVSVQVLGTKHKITTPAYRFELIQTEAVGDRRQPLKVKAAVYDGSEPVTSVATVTFDSTSGSIEARKKSIRLELRTGTFDKARPYRLVLRDAETDAEVQSMPVVIDRSFEDDF